MDLASFIMQNAILIRTTSFAWRNMLHSHYAFKRV